MRLLHTTTLQFKFFLGQPPEYVILSHRWEDEEVTFDDMSKGTAQSKKGYAKVLGTCALAAKDEYEWVWIDSCCIDKSSSAELQEAINSMFKWYRDANICWGEEFPTSKWFRRGWTLQELIAPRLLEFYAKDWAAVGSKLQRVEEIHKITGIPKDVLIHQRFQEHNVAERLSWAAHRQLSREEDAAYCLLGLFSINIPLLYGEGGSNAFRRLQAEIFRSSMDHTLFLFTKCGGWGRPSMLAHSVQQFCQVKPCTLCPSHWTETFTLDVPYRSLYPISLRRYTEILGPSRVHQELIFAAPNVLAPLRIVVVHSTDGKPSRVEQLKNHNEAFSNGAAVLRVHDFSGRWVCLGLNGPQVNPYDWSPLRDSKTYFVVEKSLPRQVDEKLTPVFNPLGRPAAPSFTSEVQFQFVSRDVDLLRALIRCRKIKEAKDEKSKDSEQEMWQPSLHVSVSSSGTISLPIAGGEYLGHYELLLHAKIKGHDEPAILVIIRNLVSPDTPYIHTIHLHKLSEIDTVKLDYVVRTDRCNLRLPDGRLVSISLRRKPSLPIGVGDFVVKRFEVTAEL